MLKKMVYHRNGDDPERDTDGIMSANPFLFEFMVDETGVTANVIDTDASYNKIQKSNQSEKIHEID